MRYGFNKDIEFFSSVNFYSLYTHYDSSENFLTQNDKGFNSLVLGAIYQVKHEDETPSLLFGTTVDVINKVSFSKLNEDKNVYFKGYTFFATSYYTVDPIVFLLQTTYRLNMENQYKQDSIEVADKFSLVPQLYFAANPYISINTGIRYSYQTKTKVNGKNIINSGSSLTYLLGVSYEINTKTILDISIDYSNSMGISQNNLSLGVIYKF
ncbi:MAG: hypothetical protein KU38_08795 [Sulfurovum sp. FS08-3]|nr:MAG: hypothetical protein KU38_08795 [Sulfurovum sp. FS08-3]